MPASSSDAIGRWRKLKMEHPSTSKSKLKEPDNDDPFDDNEEDEDPDLDPPQNNHEPYDQATDRTAHISRQKGSEELSDGGLQISNFPVAIKRVVNRPHLSVFRIVEAERAARNGESGAQGPLAVLENISYGQLEALSAVPKDSPFLLGENSNGGSHVITPPRIVPGRGVAKRLGSEARVHVVPVHSDWFSPNSVHRLERQVVPHFFSGKSSENTPEKYIMTRNSIVAKYMENPEIPISLVDCQGVVPETNNDDLGRIFWFLDHWGIINYSATPLKNKFHKDGDRLFEDSNGELRVPSPDLKSMDSLIRFERPKCRLKAFDLYPKFEREEEEEDSDFDSTIREQLSEHYCCYCSQSVPTVFYQSRKEINVQLCLDCFHDGRFVVGHSSLDFVKSNYSSKDYNYLDGDNWSDQETLLLLEGMQLYKENWNKISDHVGSKSKAQCILHFVRLPLDGASIDVPAAPSSSKFSSHGDLGRSESSSYGSSWLPGGDSENDFPFANSGNPVMNLVAFLASVMGPRVAAACAHESLAALSKDAAENVPISSEKVIFAAKHGLIAGALKAKLFADHEEREIQRLSANIVNHQFKRLELKLKQFAEIETLLLKECEQLERARQRIAAEKAIVMSRQFGSTGAYRTMGAPGVGTPIQYYNNNPSGSNWQEISVSGYGNNQPIHRHISLMQQQGMFGFGQRMPISYPASNPTSSIGYPMNRDRSGFG